MFCVIFLLAGKNIFSVDTLIFVCILTKVFTSCRLGFSFLCHFKLSSLVISSAARNLFGFLRLGLADISLTLREFEMTGFDAFLLKMTSAAGCAKPWEC